MSESNRPRISTRAKTAAAAACCATLVVGGALAFFSDTETKTNTFTVITSSDFDKDGWVTEPEWDKTPEDHTNIVPGQVITKDPTVTNGTSTDAWTYLKVEVPRATFKTTGEATATEQDFFTFEANAGWTSVSDTTTPDMHTFVYALGNGATPAKPNAKGTLFDEVTYADVANGQNTPKSLDIKVTGYIVQYSADASPTQSAKSVWEGMTA